MGTDKLKFMGTCIISISIISLADAGELSKKAGEQAGKGVFKGAIKGVIGLPIDTTKGVLRASKRTKGKTEKTNGKSDAQKVE